MLKVERWWRELHQRLEEFYKDDLSRQQDQCLYDPSNDIHTQRIF